MGSPARDEPQPRLKNVVPYFSSFQSGTRHLPQGLAYHLLRSHRAARLFFEFLTQNVSLQCVTTSARRPVMVMDLMP